VGVVAEDAERIGQRGGGQGDHQPTQQTAGPAKEIIKGEEDAEDGDSEQDVVIVERNGGEHGCLSSFLYRRPARQGEGRLLPRCRLPTARARARTDLQRCCAVPQQLQWPSFYSEAMKNAVPSYANGTTSALLSRQDRWGGSSAVRPPGSLMNRCYWQD